MAIYGFFVSAPLGHYLVGLLQKVFAGKVGVKHRIAQLLASNLLIAPIQTSGGFDSDTDIATHNLLPIVFLASMAVINGAKSVEEVIRTVRAGFFAVIRVSTNIALSRFVRTSAR